MDIADEVKRANHQLLKLKQEVQDMRGRGMGGQLNQKHPRPTRNQFVRNYTSLKQAQSQLYSSQSAGQTEALSQQIRDLKGILTR